MSNTSLQPYLFFGGRCQEALDFYASAIGAEMGMVMRFSESPEPTPPGMLAPGFEDKIMHAEFRVGAARIFASDGCDDTSRFNGFRLALSIDAESDIDQVFNALADGGTVDMPLCETFWSPRYGMLTDRFGMGWMVMTAAAQESHA